MLETSFRLEVKDKKQLRDFIQKENYEPFLLDLMIKTPFISDETKIIINQSNSENDFYDPVNDKYFEATLLANTKMITGVINSLAYLASEECFKDKRNILEVFKERIKSKKSKNAAIILFNIFPEMFPKFQGTITDVMFNDEADSIISIIKEMYHKDLNNKEIILVSFNWDGSFYYRTLNSKNYDLFFINDCKMTDFPFIIRNPKTKIVEKP